MHLFLFNDFFSKNLIFKIFAILNLVSGYKILVAFERSDFYDNRTDPSETGSLS